MKTKIDEYPKTISNIVKMCLVRVQEIIDAVSNREIGIPIKCIAYLERNLADYLSALMEVTDIQDEEELYTQVSYIFRELILDFIENPSIVEYFDNFEWEKGLFEKRYNGMKISLN